MFIHTIRKHILCSVTSGLQGSPSSNSKTRMERREEISSRPNPCSIIFHEDSYKSIHAWTTPQEHQQWINAQWECCGKTTDNCTGKLNLNNHEWCQKIMGAKCMGGDIMIDDTTIHWCITWEALQGWSRLYEGWLYIVWYGYLALDTQVVGTLVFTVWNVLTTGTKAEGPVFRLTTIATKGVLIRWFGSDDGVLQIVQCPMRYFFCIYSFRDPLRSWE